MKNNPPIIGITGGIGSGKSTICKIFETLGVPTYYADDRAKWLMQNDEALIRSIKKEFGDKSYSNGKLDRSYVAKQVFKHDDLLKKLNSLVHPIVEKDVEKWVFKNKNTKLLLKEAALLFETGSYKSLDKTILVTAPIEIRIPRILKRDKYRSEQEVNNIIKKQMSDREKTSLADYVIENDGEKALIEQVTRIFNDLPFSC